MLSEEARMKQLFVMDPFAKLHIEVDTSVLIINEAVRRGHEVYSCTEHGISQQGEKKRCRALRHEEEITPSFSPEGLEPRRYDLEHSLLAQAHEIVGKDILEIVFRGRLVVADIDHACIHHVVGECLRIPVCVGVGTQCGEAKCGHVLADFVRKVRLKSIVRRVVSQTEIGSPEIAVVDSPPPHG